MTYGSTHNKNQAKNRAQRRREQAQWKQGRAAEPILQVAREAETFFLIDQQRRSVETALRDPKVYVYLVQPGAVEETLLDPRIDEAFTAGAPIFLCFARHEDAIEMQSTCRQLRLAMLPAMGRA